MDINTVSTQTLHCIIFYGIVNISVNKQACTPYLWHFIIDIHELPFMLLLDKTKL